MRPIEAARAGFWAFLLLRRLGYLGRIDGKSSRSEVEHADQHSIESRSRGSPLGLVWWNERSPPPRGVVELEAREGWEASVTPVIGATRRLRSRRGSARSSGARQ